MQDKINIQLEDDRRFFKGVVANKGHLYLPIMFLYEAPSYPDMETSDYMKLLKSSIDKDIGVMTYKYNKRFAHRNRNLYYIKLIPYFDFKIDGKYVTMTTKEE